MIRRLRFFSRDERGTALVELAIVFPLMMTLYLGCFEATRVIRADINLQEAAQTVADLVAQQSTVGTTTISDFCSAGKLVMTPLSGTALSVAIASVTRDSQTGTVALDWQDTTCGSASSISNPTTLASSLVTNNGDSVVIVRAYYAYTSPISFVFQPSYSLSETAYARPRNTNSVDHS